MLVSLLLGEGLLQPLRIEKTKASCCRRLIVLTELEAERLILLFGVNTSFLNASLLAGEVAEVVELGAAHLTVLVHLDALDGGRLNGEDTLYADVTRHLAYGKALLLSVTGNFDNNTAVQLYALLVTFDDFVSNGNGVTSAEFGVLLTSCISFFSNLN